MAGEKDQEEQRVRTVLKIEISETWLECKSELWIETPAIRTVNSKHLRLAP